MTALNKTEEIDAGGCVLDGLPPLLSPGHAFELASGTGGGSFGEFGLCDSGGLLGVLRLLVALPLLAAQKRSADELGRLLSLLQPSKRGQGAERAQSNFQRIDAAHFLRYTLDVGLSGAQLFVAVVIDLSVAKLLTQIAKGSTGVVLSVISETGLVYELS